MCNIDGLLNALTFVHKMFVDKINLDIGKTVEHNKNYLLLVTQYFYLLYNATIFDPTMGSSSGQEQKIGDMKCTWKCLTGSRCRATDNDDNNSNK
jgi:hypothetical protein